MKLVVQIVRFVDAIQPGWVECEFVDAAGLAHHFIDKVPIFSSDDLDETSAYPCAGTMRSELLRQWRDEAGRELALVTTERPDFLKSVVGESEFVVLAAQLTREAE